MFQKLSHREIRSMWGPGTSYILADSATILGVFMK